MFVKVTGTAKNHVSNILLELEVRDHTRAVLRAIELGILQHVPVLVVHGDADASAPLPLTGEPTAALLQHGRRVVIPGAGDGLYASFAARLQRRMIAFIESV